MATEEVTSDTTVVRDRRMDASDEKLAEADSIAKAPILRTLGWLSTHVTHRETETNMPANMVSNIFQKEKKSYGSSVHEYVYRLANRHW